AGIIGGDEILRDGEFIRVPMMVMDGAAIKAVEDGKVELSAGYVSTLVWGAGKTPEGLTFDAQQTDIRINHVAIVREARGGPMLKLGDALPNADAYSDVQAAIEAGKGSTATWIPTRNNNNIMAFC